MQILNKLFGENCEKILPKVDSGLNLTKPTAQMLDKFNSLQLYDNSSNSDTRAVARTLIGGCIFTYSGSARIVSFEIKLISKEVSRA